MAKFTKEQSKNFLAIITRAEINEISKKYNYGWQTLYDVLRGSRHYDGGRPERKAMINEALDLIRTRAINAMEVVGVKRVEA